MAFVYDDLGREPRDHGVTPRPTLGGLRFHGIQFNYRHILNKKENPSLGY